MGTKTVKLTANMGDPVTAKRVNLIDWYMKEILTGSAAQREPGPPHSRGF